MSSTSTTNSAFTFALTTTFTPAPTCTEAIGSYGSNPSPLYFWGSSAGITTVFRLGYDSCYPGLYFEANQKVIYSPGMCPSGWRMSAISLGASQGTSFTRATCCPSDAPLIPSANGVFEHCLNPATSPATFVVSDTKTTVDDRVAFAQKAVVVEWASNDLPNFTPASAPLNQLHLFAGSVTSTIASSTPGPTPKNTRSRPAATATMTTKNLTTGAEAGIGVGVSIGALIIVAITAYILLMRRRKSRQSKQISPRETWDDFENNGKNTAVHTRNTQLSPSEMYTPLSPSEIYTEPTQYELGTGQ